MIHRHLDSCQCDTCLAVRETLRSAKAVRIATFFVVLATLVTIVGEVLKVAR